MDKFIIPDIYLYNAYCKCRTCHYNFSTNFNIVICHICLSVIEKYCLGEFIVIRHSGFKITDIVSPNTIILEPTKFNFNPQGSPTNLLKSIFESKAIYTHKGDPFIIESEKSDEFSKLVLKTIKP